MYPPPLLSSPKFSCPNSGFSREKQNVPCNFVLNYLSPNSQNKTKLSRKIETYTFFFCLANVFFFSPVKSRAEQNTRSPRHIITKVYVCVGKINNGFKHGNSCLFSTYISKLFGVESKLSLRKYIAMMNTFAF